jgi:hypothetical protein
MLLLQLLLRWVEFGLFTTRTSCGSPCRSCRRSRRTPSKNFLVPLDVTVPSHLLFGKVKCLLRQRFIRSHLTDQDQSLQACLAIVPATVRFQVHFSSCSDFKYSRVEKDFYQIQETGKTIKNYEIFFSTMGRREIKLEA